jgi:Tfp pilus assembly protein FimV
VTQHQQQTPEEIRREIERTRRELADTVEALSHKADVKEQARQKKDELQQRVTSNPTPLLVIGGLVAAFVVLRLVRRR